MPQSPAWAARALARALPDMHAWPLLSSVPFQNPRPPFGARASLRLVHCHIRAGARRTASRVPCCRIPLLHACIACLGCGLSIRVRAGGQLSRSERASFIQARGMRTAQGKHSAPRLWLECQCNTRKQQCVPMVLVVAKPTRQSLGDRLQLGEAIAE